MIISQFHHRLPPTSSYYILISMPSHAVWTYEVILPPRVPCPPLQTTRKEKSHPQLSRAPPDPPGRLHPSRYYMK